MAFSTSFSHTKGSREFNGSLYNLITETKNWYDAKENCESLGGNLTDIRSSAEQDFIIELFDVYVKVWTGGSNAVDENTFSWLDGSAVSSGYTNWAPNQPWHPCGGIRCISVLQTWSYRWNDEACDNKMRSVCKFS
ncbi:lectin-like [Mercenaria mercenaria]|uniref:lectin-like n=1 Tax=Mercenaria mercenaria TaxID=6596 RepID=UPI00234F9386|nr:lectin-like [Mercenaria mercenaria]